MSVGAYGLCCLFCRGGWDRWLFLSRNFRVVMAVLHKKTVKCFLRVWLVRQQAFKNCVLVGSVPEGLQVFKNFRINVMN